MTADLFNRLLLLATDFDVSCALCSRTVGGNRFARSIGSQPACRRPEALIKTGERKPVALLQSVTTRWLEFSEVEDLTGAYRFFDNINTPQDYARVSENNREVVERCQGSALPARVVEFPQPSTQRSCCYGPTTTLRQEVFQIAVANPATS